MKEALDVIRQFFDGNDDHQIRDTLMLWLSVVSYHGNFKSPDETINLLLNQMREIRKGKEPSTENFRTIAGKSSIHNIRTSVELELATQHRSEQELVQRQNKIDKLERTYNRILAEISTASSIKEKLSNEIEKLKKERRDQKTVSLVTKDVPAVVETKNPPEQPKRRPVPKTNS